MSDETATTAQHDLDRAALPRVGALLADRYLLVEEVGQGGMGVVFRAHDVLVGEDVALKLLDPGDGGADAAGVLRELTLARKVTHKNVARIFDVGRDDRRTFLTMELVSGESLRRRLDRERRLSTSVAAGIVAQLVDGLAAAHEAGVVHCDLKPGNVLVSADGRVVVIDFGVARALRAASAHGGDAPRIEGTLDYMAPEQVKGEAVTTSTDVYAVGLLLFEAAQGARPFHGDNPAARGFARCVRPAPPLGDDVEAEYRSLVAACLAQDPAARPSTDGLLAQLRGIAAPTAHALGSLASASTTTAPGVARGRLVVREADATPEELRARIEAFSATPRMQDDVVDAYVAARRALSSPSATPADVVDSLDACLARAPGDPLITAARAVACARTWRYADFGSTGTRQQAQAALALARAVAPNCADTHLADAIVAGDEGRLGDVVPALNQALVQAPTHAFAHDALGRMECEAGRAATGMERLRLAAQLDARHANIGVQAARAHALRGRLDLFDAELAPLVAPDQEPPFETLMILVRVADWFERPERAAAVIPRVPLGKRVGHAFVELYARLVAGDDEVMERLNALEGVFDELESGVRARATVYQLGVEIFARRDVPRARSYLQRLTALAFTDVEWLQLCPSLEALRDEPALAACRAATHANVARLWGGRR